MKRLAALMVAAGCATERGAPGPAGPETGANVNPTAAASTAQPAAPAADAVPPVLRLPDTVRPMRYRPTLTIVPGALTDAEIDAIS